MFKKYRKANIVLHAKLPRSKYCICGSIMKNLADWTCVRQMDHGEPKVIQVLLPDKPIIKDGRHRDVTLK